MYERENWTECSEANVSEKMNEIQHNSQTLWNDFTEMDVTVLHNYDILVIWNC